MAIEASRDEGSSRIRYGMAGGGRGAFIGAVHRLAARMDDHYELVCGALSSEPERARASGLALGLPGQRAYGSWQEMIAQEAKRPAAQRMEAVVIVTPNDSHFVIARAALEAGFHVICDKPLVTNSADAEALAKLVKKSGKIFCLTHNYSGYPLMRQARAMVAAGELGDIRVIYAQYAQGWLSEALEKTGQKQAAWRTDPKRSGPAGCLGDIGTHAFHLACFVTGLKPEAVLADLSTFVKGRKLDDNAQMLIRFKGGAKATLWASQVAVGQENGIRLMVHGTRGGLEWGQENPNYLWFTPLGKPKICYSRAGDGTWPEAARISRTPSGHPEGYLEGFANLYAEAAQAIRAHRTGQKPDAAVLYPTVDDGLLGVKFIEAAVKSSREGNVWVRI